MIAEERPILPIASAAKATIVSAVVFRSFVANSKPFGCLKESEINPTRLIFLCNPLFSAAPQSSFQIRIFSLIWFVFASGN